MEVWLLCVSVVR